MGTWPYPMVDHVQGYGMIIRGHKATPLDIPAPVYTIAEALKAFVQAIKRQDAPPISVVDGYQAVEIAEACYHSVSTGDAVEILSDDEDDDLLDDLDESPWSL